MKNFVLYSSLEVPHKISKEEFEKYTKSQFPFKQNIGGKICYYATCPECENPIQIRGLYTSERKYGAHTGKNIIGFNPFNYENYIYCPRAVKGKHVKKEERKKVSSKKDIAVYNTLRDNFDLAVSYAKKHLGYFISDDEAKKCLETYYESQGWLYPHSTVNNIPFMLFYLQPAINPYGLLIRKGSELEKAILEVKDLKLESISGKSKKYYNSLTRSGSHYISLTMMLWHHQFKEEESGLLNESINIEISKDISKKKEVHDWQTLVEQRIPIPELGFIKFINAKTVYRNKKLQDFAHKLMPPI